MEKIYRGMANGAETIDRNFNNGYGQKVGDIHISIDSSNPSARFGGTWERIAKGQAIVGVDERDSDFSIPEKTGGEKTHALTAEENGPHTHSYKMTGNNNAVKVEASTTFGTSQSVNTNTGTSGEGRPHNNLQPFFTLYIWKRTA